MVKIYIYIHLPDNPEDFIDTREGADKFVREFLTTIDLADCEKGSKVYYCQTEKKSFITNLSVLGELISWRKGNYGLGETLNILINNSEIRPIEESRDANYIYSIYNCPPYDSCDKLLQNFSVLFEQAAKHSLEGTNPDNKVILLNPSRMYRVPNPVPIIRRRYNEEKPQMTSIPLVTNFIELDDWLQKNREERKFNSEDERHIEASPRYIKGKSPLLDGKAGQQHASELLKSAIGDKRKCKYLINFDHRKNEYIRYEDENSNNQYHAYHLVLPDTHRRDQDAVNQVSDRIKDILNYRNSNN